jgi:hypothetical protein
MEAGAGSGLESYVCCSFGLGKSKVSCKGCRVPFKHKLANLLVDELGNKFLNQGYVVVELLDGVRAVVEVAETSMPSSDVFRRNLLRNVVLCAGVHASGGQHELLLVPCDEVLCQVVTWTGGLAARLATYTGTTLAVCLAAFSAIAALASLTRRMLGQALISHTSK